MSFTLIIVNGLCEQHAYENEVNKGGNFLSLVVLLYYPRKSSSSFKNDISNASSSLPSSLDENSTSSF
jgi:hypothetical protein